MTDKIEFTPSGSRLVVAAGNSPDLPIVRVFELTQTLPGKMHKSKAYRFHQKAIVQVTVSPDGSQICSLSQDGKVRIWTENSKSPHVVASFNGEPTAITWTEFGIFVGMKDGNLHKILIGMGVIQSTKLHTSIQMIRMIKDANRQVLVKLADDQLLLFDTNSGRKVATLAEEICLFSVDAVHEGIFLYLNSSGTMLHTSHTDNLDTASTIRLGSYQSSACFLSGSGGSQVLVGNSAGLLQRILVLPDRSNLKAESEASLIHKPLADEKIKYLQYKIDKVDARLATLLVEAQKIDRRTQDNSDKITMMWNQAIKNHPSHLISQPNS